MHAYMEAKLPTPPPCNKTATGFLQVRASNVRMDDEKVAYLGYEKMQKAALRGIGLKGECAVEIIEPSRLAWRENSMA